ncbi:MAG: PEP-utilizing enzyme [Actinomycetota bacterium]|nr:PEP-utilizing enzyme [Actinomycetota bacterium]
MTEADATWAYDASHYPEPMSPLSADVWFWAMGEGIQAAARALRAPFGGFETMTYGGGWAYEHELEPDWEPDPAGFERQALEIGERWERDYRPRVEAITEEIRRMRPERPSPGEAVRLLDRLVELLVEQWTIHFLTVVSVHAARELLHDAYVERFGKSDELEPYGLVEGLPNETLAADERLWEVAQLARRLDVADAILELPAAAALERLAGTHQGRRVLHALTHYLERYGGRSRLHELSEPRVAERPEIALEGLRLFLERPRDLPGERRESAEERKRREREALARIEDEADRVAFAGLLARVAAAVPLEETHAYFIDYPGLQAARETLLGFGRRLVAEGRLDNPEDVFMLRRSELREAVSEPWGRRLQDLATARREELGEARRGAPPRYLGPPPAADQPIPPLVAKFYGVPGTARLDGDVLRGTGASAGRTVGIARLVRGREDFARVASGDVLVCTTTTPAWTPLFGSIGGLVTDTGGILCHAAVVAREYSIPAVVGTEVATATIPDGSRVELDGGAGTVTILRGSPIG